MIKIKETKRCDTRAIVKTFTEEDVLKDTIAHQEAVKLTCQFIADKLLEQAKNHDYTKIGDYLPMFTMALKTGFKDDEFKKLNWWKIHIDKERHHLNGKAPDDVNIVDVIEMLCDCVCAGLARNGKVYTVSINKEVLNKAITNTIDLLIKNIEVVKEKGVE